MRKVKLLTATSDEFWDWFCSTSPPDNSQKDYNCHLPAPPAKRGGSKAGKRKKPKPKSFAKEYMQV